MPTRLDTGCAGVIDGITSCVREVTAVGDVEVLAVGIGTPGSQAVIEDFEFRGVLQGVPEPED